MLALTPQPEVNPLYRVHQYGARASLPAPATLSVTLQQASQTADVTGVTEASESRRNKPSLRLRDRSLDSLRSLLGGSGSGKEARGLPLSAHSVVIDDEVRLVYICCKNGYRTDVLCGWQLGIGVCLIFTCWVL